MRKVTYQNRKLLTQYIRDYVEVQNGKTAWCVTSALYKPARIEVKQSGTRFTAEEKLML